MQEDILRFFRPINHSFDVKEDDYVQAKVCISMADAMARNTNSSLYIIDYNQKNFLYVSPNPLFLCGYTPEEVRGKGYGFYFEVVPAEEIRMLFEINEAGFYLFGRHSSEEKYGMTIEYDFHIKACDGRFRLIHHKLTPVLLDKDGYMWLALCTVSLSPASVPGNVLMTCKHRPVHWAYSFEGQRWKELPNVVLTDRETDILQLAVKGFSNTEIGEALFVDANTVKFHKKKLFQKLHAKNITEAISIASNLRLI